MMKKEKNQLKNKKFWKWTGYSLFLILFGTSAIVNVAYLPKYFVLKNYEEQTKNQVLTINISAYDDKNGNTKLFNYIYQTTQKTLGKLMVQDPETFYLTNNGTWLEGIIYYNEQGKKETISSKNPYYWMVYYNGKIAGIGIADLYLHKNDNIALHYQKFN